MEILLEKQQTLPWVKKLLSYFKHNNQNRAIIQETYQKSTLWNACGKLLSVCQLVIVVCASLHCKKVALQGSRALWRLGRNADIQIGLELIMKEVCRLFYNQNSDQKSYPVNFWLNWNKKRRWYQTYCGIHETLKEFSSQLISLVAILQEFQQVSNFGIYRTCAIITHS